MSEHLGHTWHVDPTDRAVRCSECKLSRADWQAKQVHSATAHWRLEPFKAHDKDIYLYGPGDLSITIDYDDADHRSVEASIPVILEVLNKVKKLYRDRHVRTADEQAELVEDIALELSDVLTYMMCLCYVLDIDLVEAYREKVAINNDRFPVKR